MGNVNRASGNVIDTDVLVLGSGAAGCGAAIAAKGKGARVLMLDKGKIESSGNLGGGNDHFMAILNTDPKTDSAEALVNWFHKGPLTGSTPTMVEKGWAEQIPIIFNILKDIGVEFIQNEDGSWLRSVGFGAPGAWYMHIRNGHKIKRLLAHKIRSMDVEVMDHIMVTKLLTGDGHIAGCAGYNRKDGTFYVFRAKKVVLALGHVATRGWTNSTGNPYNIWYSPYNTGSHFVLAYDAGVKLLNLDIVQQATLIPKGYGAPGMNGINGMGGRELNALGERFMGKYDPMWENGLRINQISGTYQELIEGKGPPFFMDMTHFKKEDARHLQYVLMPGDKNTYVDYCEQRGIDFAKYPLEVEISELAFGGHVLTNENFETNLNGLFNGCIFRNFSGAMCSGHYAGGQAADAALQTENRPDVDEAEVNEEKERIFRPMKNEDGISYKDFEGAIRQVMSYYMGYRRNQKGMELALDRLNFLEGYVDELKATNYHELMRANEASELIKMCQLATRASMERKESGRAYYRRTDYPELNPEFNKPLVVWQENGEHRFSWGI